MSSTPISSKGTVVSVVVQTHWDREWYLPHQTFIARLLHVMEIVAGQLESGQLDSFLFDGQTAAMEDLLGNCEPALGARIRRLVRQHKIVLGPWYVMADQFLCSGEALLRNLEIGIADAAALGNCQKVGYLPDTFGHIAQMPQLLRNVGIGSAVMWRGIDIDQSEFDWRAPDGSVAGAIFLTQGYYQHPLNGAQWQQGLDTYLGQVAPRSRAGRLLLTQGGDHLVSSGDLKDRIARFNQSQQNFLLVEDTLASHVEAALAGSAGQRQLVEGELRQNGQVFVLPDVLSTRRYLKRLNQEAEDRMLGVVEPLLAQLPFAGDYPAAYLEQTWRLLLQQQAHDSICGCSADDVHDEMRQRYVLLGQRMDALVERACAGAGMRALTMHAGDGDPFADDSAFTLFNPLPHPAEGWHEVTLFLKGQPGGLELRTCAGDLLAHTVLAVAPRRQLRSPLDDFPDMLDGHQYTVAIDCRLGGLEALACTAAITGAGAPAASGGTAIENAALAIAFAHGRLTLTDKRSGALHADPFLFLSELDAGDSYNFSPPPAQRQSASDRFTLEALSIRAELQEMLIGVRLDLPRGLDDARHGAADDIVQCHGQLRLRLWQGNGALECHLDWHNAACDQRTRLLLPLAPGLDATYSDSAFSWQRRPVVLADYPTTPSRREMPVCVNPSTSVVAAGGLAVAHRAMQEYEVVQLGERRYLGLTLVRSVGWLSRRDLVTRGVGAGPDMPTPGAQCLGSEPFDFSIGLIDEGDAVQALAQARRLRQPPQLLRGHASQWRTPFDLAPDGLQASAVRRVGDLLELRLWNPTAGILPCALPGGWQRVLADGSPCAGGDAVAPHAIATFRRPL